MTLSMGDAGHRCCVPECHEIPVVEVRGQRWCFVHAKQVVDEQPRA